MKYLAVLLLVVAFTAAWAQEPSPSPSPGGAFQGAVCQMYDFLELVQAGPTRRSFFTTYNATVTAYNANGATEAFVDVYGAAPGAALTLTLWSAGDISDRSATSSLGTALGSFTLTADEEGRASETVRFPAGVGLGGNGGMSLLGHAMTLTGGSTQLSCVTGMQYIDFARNTAGADNSATEAICDLQSVPLSQVFGRVLFTGGSFSAKVCNVRADVPPFSSSTIDMWSTEFGDLTDNVKTGAVVEKLGTLTAGPDGSATLSGSAPGLQSLIGHGVVTFKYAGVTPPGFGEPISAVCVVGIASSTSVDDFNNFTCVGDRYGRNVA